MAVPIAIGIGYLCDREFGSAPVGVFVGTVVGFAAMLLRIVRMRPSEDEPQAAKQNAAPPKVPSNRVAETVEPVKSERPEESDR